MLKIDNKFKMPARSKVYARKPRLLVAIPIGCEFTCGGRKGKPGDYLVQCDDGFILREAEDFEREYEEVKVGSISR